MGEVVSLETIRSRAPYLTERIRKRFEHHPDWGLIQNMMDEYGPRALAVVLEREYGVEL